MKQIKALVSGCCDGSFLIMYLNRNVFVPLEARQVKYGQICCITMNTKEDILITGQTDRRIYFWKDINDSSNQSKHIDIQSPIRCISLNEQENKLSVCGEESKITVIQCQIDESDDVWYNWSIIQTIQVSQMGYRLTFTKGNQFIFQPATQYYIELFDYDEEQEQFKKIKDIKVQSCDDCKDSFPCQYFNNLKIITVKHGQFLNILRINDEGEYELIQTIEFQNSKLLGKFSGDGKFLVTWEWIIENSNQKIKSYTMIYQQQKILIQTMSNLQFLYKYQYFAKQFQSNIDFEFGTGMGLYGFFFMLSDILIRAKKYILQTKPNQIKIYDNRSLKQ